MNAIQFIKDHGVDKAREVVEGVPDGAEVYAYRSKTYFSSPNCIYDEKLSIWEEMDRGMDLDLYEEQLWLDDLKRIVESVERINFIGGIDEAKNWIKKTHFGLEHSHYSSSSVATIEEKIKRNEQAIADYEQIYSGAAQ